jgi:hypothetical protein
MKLYDWQIDLINKFRPVNMNDVIGHFNMMINGIRVRCSIEIVPGYDYGDPSNDPIFLVKIAPRHGDFDGIYLATNYRVNLVTKSVKNCRTTKATIMDTSTSPGLSMKLNQHEQKRMVYRCRKVLRKVINRKS